MTSFRDKPTTNLFAATIFRKQEVDYVEKINQPFIFKKGTSGVLHYFYNLDLKVFRINLRSGGPFQNGCLSKFMVAISTTYSDQTKNVLNATHTGFILWIFNNLQQHCQIFTQKYYQIKVYIKYTSILNFSQTAFYKTATIYGKLPTCIN